MSKKTYVKHLLDRNPILLDLSKYYETLGLAEAVLWAKGELDGEPSVATAALVYAFHREIPSHRECEDWISQLRGGHINVDDAELLNQAQCALEQLEIAGVSMSTLFALIRIARAETANNIAQLIDHGAEISCIPRPIGRESNWQLFETDADGHPKHPISGFSTIVRTLASQDES